MSSSEPGSPTDRERDNDNVLSSLEMFHIGTNDRPASSSSPQSTISAVLPFSPWMTNETSRSSSSPGTSSGTCGASSGISVNSNTTSSEPQTSTHPLLSASKHVCCVCGDNSTGKHYTVHSCEGCKGFFRRSICKGVIYNCLRDNKCVVDKKKRNRCQSCRFQKCLNVGMNPDSVQGERVGTREPEVVATSSVQVKTPLELMVEAEKRVEEPNLVIYNNETLSATEICRVAEKEMFQLFEWAKNVPHFNTFSLYDRMLLLRAGWNELLILGIAYRSMRVEHALVLANGLIVNSDSAELVGLDIVFAYVRQFIVDFLRCRKADKAELACLKSIILFNPEASQLPQDSILKVESVRDNVYTILEQHTQSKYPEQHLRYAKLLIKLADLRTAGEACMEKLFFDRVISGNTIEYYVARRLQTTVNIL